MELGHLTRGVREVNQEAVPPGEPAFGTERRLRVAIVRPEGSQVWRSRLVSPWLSRSGWQART